MIKVVQVVSDTNVAGAGRYLLNYLKYFDRNKFEVCTVIPENSLLKPHIEEIKDVMLIEAPFMADKTYDKRCTAYLTDFFKKYMPDIVHTHASLSARIAARKAKTAKIVSTRHCLEPTSVGLLSMLKGKINSLLCDMYVAVADSVYQNLVDSYIPEKKIKTVYNGVEQMKKISAEEIAEVRMRYGIAEDEVLFGIFARLEPIKGHKYFLKAAREFLKTGRSAKFIIAGDGSLREELKNTAVRYDIEKNVIFTGFLSDTTELLNAIDVNVISSESEAMCLSILEAMSLKKPTIASDAGGNSQLVETDNTGVLTHPCDSSSLKDAMIKLADDRVLREKFGLRANLLYEQNFTAKKMIQNLEALYVELLK